MPGGRLHLVQVRDDRHLVRDRHAEPAHIAEGPNAADRPGDILDPKGQVDEIQPQFLKRRIVDCGREGMLHRVAEQSAELGFCVNFHSERSASSYLLLVNFCTTYWLPVTT